MAEDICGVQACRDAYDQLLASDVLLRETIDRVTNALQTVMAMSTISAGPARRQSASARDQMRMRIASIAIVHEMLSASGASDAVAIGDYLAKLAASISTLWSGPNAISLAVHHSGESVAANVAVRLGMVVNELVTNSFKYAYGDRAAGEIRIAFSIRDGFFVLIVADDGRGIDCEVDRRDGLGSRLIKDIARQLDASFNYQSARPGTIAVFSGPADVLPPSNRDTPAWRLPRSRSLNDRNWAVSRQSALRWISGKMEIAESAGLKGVRWAVSGLCAFLRQR